MKNVVRLLALVACCAGLVAVGQEAAAKKGKPPSIALTVTEKGFEPERIKVKKGEKVKLVVTRTTDKTCATELIIDDPPHRASLPLNQAVTIPFVSSKTGELKYGCAMDKMIAGVIVVE